MAVSTQAEFSSDNDNSRETQDSDVAAEFAKDLPPSIALPSSVGRQSRLERFDSLARGESSDGVRHSR